MLKKKEVNDILSTIDRDSVKKKVLKFFEKDVEKYSQRLIKLDGVIKSSDKVSMKKQKSFFAYTDEIINKANELEEVLGHGYILQKIKNTFRNSLVSVPIYKSLIVKRAYSKPRGYPGDYQMIELFYNNKSISQGIGVYGDKYILSDNYVNVVRKRKDTMKEILRDYIKNSKLSSINILNIGCGSCREIRELFNSKFKTRKKINFTFIDQDEEALSFSRAALKHISGSSQKNIKFKFIKENVVNLFRKEKYKKILKGQDMVYSIGLADYLPDTYLGELTKFCFELLKPKGKLVIAHKNVTRFKALAPDWFCGWYFFSRSKQYLAEMIKTYMDANKYKMAIKKENLKYVFFIFINRA